MRCGLGFESKPCIEDHYARVRILELRKSGTGPHWRGRCPLCGWTGVLEVSAKLSVQVTCWGNPRCDRALLREWMRERVPCLVSPSQRISARIDPDELAELALLKIAPTSLRLALLEMAGIGTEEALDKLGVGRQNRYRVVSELRQSRRSNRR